MAIQILENVRFKIIPLEMIYMLGALITASEETGVEPAITGAAYENYPKGKVHDVGYAIDVRTANMSDPDTFVRWVRLELEAVSPHYKVLYGDEGHLDHIHIGFAWYFSRDNQRGGQNGECA